MNNHDATFQPNKSSAQLPQQRGGGSGSSSASMAKRKQQLHEYSSASPPLTEDSGQWSCSFPSSPIKEQSPHGSGKHNVKSSSGSTSSCSEYNNNSRKSQLYGTPHWWPIEQEVGDKNEQNQLPKYTDLLGSIPTATAGSVVETKDISLESTSSSSTTPGVKYSKPLAFTINFHDAPEDDNNSCSNDNQEEIPSTEVLPAIVDAAPEQLVVEAVELVVEQTTSDVKSDNGTYTLDDDDGSFVQEERTSSIQLSEIDNNEWIQKWATEASAHVPDLQPIPPYDETFKILDETRSIVNAMQNRVVTTPDNVKKNVKLKPELPSSLKFNKTFNIRRSINAQPTPAAPPSYDSDNTMSRSVMSDKYQPKQNFVRADGGRFSLRIKKGLPGSFSDTEVRNFPYAAASLPKPHKAILPSASSSRPLTTSPVRSKSILGPHSSIRNQNSTNPSSNSAKTHTRSNSTITSRDIEMENWKRRKSYDPLKASGMGVSSKKVEEVKRKMESNPAPTPTASMSTKPAPPAAAKSSTSSLPRQLRANPTQFETAQPSTPTSSVHSHSPTPYDHCCSSVGGDYVRVHDWLQLQQQLTRSSCEPVSSPRKFEALDTLVISTIFSLSNKVRNLSLGLLKKIHPAQEDDENSALIEEMITQLSDMTTTQSDKQGQKSSSKELSGILKNVKKIEQVILVLDRVLCDQDDESSSDC